MVEDGFRRASQQTIAIIDKQLGLEASCAERAEALEHGYPFWVENGLARRVWRRFAREYLKAHGCRCHARHLNGDRHGERHDERRLRRKVARDGA